MTAHHCPTWDTPDGCQCKLAVPATDRDGQGPGTLTPSPGPYDYAELEALLTSVWSLEEDDPTRFDELLSAALVFIGRVALLWDVPAAFPRHAAALLRSMEQRALWGPDHPVRQP